MTTPILLSWGHTPKELRDVLRKREMNRQPKSDECRLVSFPGDLVRLNPRLLK